jgi:hypothetical protein
MSTFFEETADKILLRLANTTPDQHKDIILGGLVDAYAVGALQEARYRDAGWGLTDPSGWRSLESYENDH